MKKIFSLVLLTGMLTLMSFSFKSKKSEEQRPWCDSVKSICEEEAFNNMDTFDLSVDEAFGWYVECTSMNGC